MELLSKIYLPLFIILAVISANWKAPVWTFIFRDIILPLVNIASLAIIGFSILNDSILTVFRLLGPLSGIAGILLFIFPMIKIINNRKNDENDRIAKVMLLITFLTIMLPVYLLNCYLIFYIPNKTLG